jgi:predicted GNAT family acetyltransferase
MTGVEIRDHPDTGPGGEGRFEAWADGELVGVADYHRAAGRVAYTHTEVQPARRQEGIGGRLAEAALADARRRGLRVAPVCPFIAHWLDAHPEYAALRERPSP